MLLALKDYDRALHILEACAEFFASEGLTKAAALASLDAAICSLELGMGSSCEAALDSLYVLLSTEELPAEATALLLAMSKKVVLGQVAGSYLTAVRSELAGLLAAQS